MHQVAYYFVTVITLAHYLKTRVIIILNSQERYVSSSSLVCLLLYTLVDIYLKYKDVLWIREPVLRIYPEISQ